jgi:hypothetical protein
MTSAVTSHPGVQVELPVRKGNKEIWDSLGVRWIGSFEGNPFLVRAELLPGWNLREEAATDFDKRSFIVIDEDGLPRVVVRMKIAPWHTWAHVDVPFPEEVERMKIALAPKAGQKEFDSLVAKYNAAVRNTDGSGSRGQAFIDKAYAKLEEFVETHTDFRSDIPTKHQCRDVGNEGLIQEVVAIVAKMRAEKAAEKAKDGD